MQSLDQHLQRLVSQGVVDKDEAKFVAENPELFEKAIF
jgi:Tfp pilus assembly pilus retraction ATPase PilT